MNEGTQCMAEAGVEQSGERIEVLVMVYIAICIQIWPQSSRPNDIANINTDTDSTHPLP